MGRRVPPPPDGFPGKLMMRMRVDGMPEVLAAMRRELAESLRAVAANEEPRTATRLREVAAAFESGQGV